MKVYLNINRAIELDKDQRRKARAPLFQKLDVDAQRALEDGDTAALELVKEVKQILRDITKDSHYENCATLAEVCKCWPQGLGPCPYPHEHYEHSHD